MSSELVNAFGVLNLEDEEALSLVDYGSISSLSPKSPEYLFAMHKMCSWSREMDLRSTLDVHMKHPEYMTWRAISSEESPIIVDLRLPGAAEQGREDVRSVSITREFTLGNPVSDILSYATTKFQQIGLDLDATRLDNFVLKVAGQQDFLLHRKAPLGLYDCATRCVRMNEKLQIVIHTLTDEDRDALQQVIQQETEALGEAFHAKYRNVTMDTYSPWATASAAAMPSSEAAAATTVSELSEQGDTLATLPPSPPPSSSSSSSSSSTAFCENPLSPSSSSLRASIGPAPPKLPPSRSASIVSRSSEYTEHEAMDKSTLTDPFEIVFEGLKLPASLRIAPFEFLQIEISLTFNGENILPPLSTEKIPLDHERIEEFRRENSKGFFSIDRQTEINTLLSLSNLPDATRVVIRVFGIKPEKAFKRSEPEGNRRLIAGASTMLFNYENKLAKGIVQLQLTDLRSKKKKQLDEGVGIAPGSPERGGGSERMGGSEHIGGGGGEGGGSVSRLHVKSNLSSVSDEDGTTLGGGGGVAITSEKRIAPSAQAIHQAMASVNAANGDVKVLGADEPSFQKLFLECCLPTAPSAVVSSRPAKSRGGFKRRSSLASMVDGYRSSSIDNESSGESFSFGDVYGGRRSSCAPTAIVQATQSEMMLESTGDVYISLRFDKQFPRTEVFIEPMTLSRTYASASEEQSITEEEAGGGGRKAAVVSPSRPPTVEEEELLLRIQRQDALYELEPNDKNVLWSCRAVCCQRPGLLSKFLRAFSWANRQYVNEAHRLLLNWAPGRPADALELLDIRYSSAVVREYAVQRLDLLSDARLQDMLLQLVQVLKYEPYHDSALSRFLLRRALLAPLTIGHQLFWMLQSELHIPLIQERFGLLLTVYLLRCGPYRESLKRQVFVNNSLRIIAEDLKNETSKQRRVEFARAQLQELNSRLTEPFCVCLTPRIELKRIRAEKCKVMESKKLPMWLVFENTDSEYPDFNTIFKDGDDLRQDQLTLQLIGMMDSLWRDDSLEAMSSSAASSAAVSISQKSSTEIGSPKSVKAEGGEGGGGSDSTSSSPTPSPSKIGGLWSKLKMAIVGTKKIPPYLCHTGILDLKMKPYGCVSTGYNSGMIEAVMNSATLAGIQTEYAGRMASSFSKTTIIDFLEENNPNAEKYQIAADHFIRTCAGYCVATYLLGIGDRHADNIMVQKSGHLFHIDFGHFLGNFKSKFGINRERAPFVFTPEMAEVVKEKFARKAAGEVPAGATQLTEFEALCCRAYNILRKRSHLLLNMFVLMIPATMPQLTARSDITYLQKQLSLELNDEQAAEKFVKEIKNSLATVSRQFDNYLHNWKHK